MINFRAALDVEVLEDRITPTTFGNAWPDAEHLTLSFAPDGAKVGDYNSELFALLDAQMPRQTWQNEIVRAFQTWAVNARINVSVVADNGADLGAPGLIQGDDRFGDIRITALPMARDVVAIATPYETAAGTWAGDVKLNSNFRYNSPGNGQYDLYSVMLHEAGHVFGLDHSANPTAVMFEDYTARYTALTSNDVDALLQLYDARTPDSFEGQYGNDTFQTAAALPLPHQLTADLGAGDVDYYRLNITQIGNIKITLQTSQASTLVSRLTVYDAWRRVVATVAATDPLRGDLTATIGGLNLLSTFYVKVESATGSVLSAGSYDLRVESLLGVLNSVTTTTVGIVQSLTTPLLSDDHHTDDSFLTAALPKKTTTEVDSHFDYAFRASISDSSDIDCYKIKVPTASGGQANVMTVMVWGLENTGLLPTVLVYDYHQNAVAAEILVNQDGSLAVQIANVVAGSTFYVKVAAQQPSGDRATGNYFLGVDFTRNAAQMKTMATGTLDQAQRQSAYLLRVNESALFHFILSANTGLSTDAAVRMTIYNARGRVVFTLVAHNRETISSNVYLPRGMYVVRFAAGTPDGSPLPSLSYTLRGSNISNPIGPNESDPTNDPATPQPPPPPEGTSDPPTADSGDSWSDDWWDDDYDYWSNDAPPETVPPADPYSDPYSPA